MLKKGYSPQNEQQFYTVKENGFYYEKERHFILPISSDLCHFWM